MEAEEKRHERNCAAGVDLPHANSPTGSEPRRTHCGRRYCRARTAAARDGQFGGVTPTAPKTDARFPLAPTWETELLEVAPNVYAYIQGRRARARQRERRERWHRRGRRRGARHRHIDGAAAREALHRGDPQGDGQAFRHVVYTHHHGDHINPKRDGWADGTEPRRILPPAITSDGTLTYYYGRTVVELMPMVPAHTYGDVVINLPKHKVLFAGDIAFFYVAPWCRAVSPDNLHFRARVLAVYSERSFMGTFWPRTCFWPCARTNAFSRSAGRRLQDAGARRALH